MIKYLIFSLRINVEKEYSLILHEQEHEVCRDDKHLSTQMPSLMKSIKPFDQTLQRPELQSSAPCTKAKASRSSQHPVKMQARTTMPEVFP